MLIHRPLGETPSLHQLWVWALWLKVALTSGLMTTPNTYQCKARLRFQINLTKAWEHPITHDRLEVRII